MRIPLNVQSLCGAPFHAKTISSKNRVYGMGYRWDLTATTPLQVATVGGAKEFSGRLFRSSSLFLVRATVRHCGSAILSFRKRPSILCHCFQSSRQVALCDKDRRVCENTAVVWVQFYPVSYVNLTSSANKYLPELQFNTRALRSGFGRRTKTFMLTTIGLLKFSRFCRVYRVQWIKNVKAESASSVNKFILSC